MVPIFVHIFPIWCSGGVNCQTLQMLPENWIFLDNLKFTTIMWLLLFKTGHILSTTSSVYRSLSSPPCWGRVISAHIHVFFTQSCQILFTDFWWSWWCGYISSIGWYTHWQLASIRLDSIDLWKSLMSNNLDWVSLLLNNEHSPITIFYIMFGRLEASKERNQTIDL